MCWSGLLSLNAVSKSVQVAAGLDLTAFMAERNPTVCPPYLRLTPPRAPGGFPPSAVTAAQPSHWPPSCMCTCFHFFGSHSPGGGLAGPGDPAHAELFKELGRCSKAADPFYISSLVPERTHGRFLLSRVRLSLCSRLPGNADTDPVSAAHGGLHSEPALASGPLSPPYSRPFRPPGRR